MAKNGAEGLGEVFRDECQILLHEMEIYGAAYARLVGLPDGPRAMRTRA